MKTNVRCMCIRSVFIDVTIVLTDEVAHMSNFVLFVGNYIISTACLTALQLSVFMLLLS